MHFNYKDTYKLKINAWGKTHHKDNTMRRRMAGFWIPITVLTALLMFPSLVPYTTSLKHILQPLNSTPIDSHLNSYLTYL